MLAVDVNSETTRALLFDVVEGRFRFIGAGSATTTATRPYEDISEGLRLALDNLQEISTRRLVDAEDRLIMPSQGDGSGVDSFVATLSVGPPLNVVAAGLLDDVSALSAQRLAMTTETRLVDTICLNDGRKQEQFIDGLLTARPDVIILAGGTEGGAFRSVIQLAELIGKACHLTPAGHRPEVLYAGNQAAAEQVRSIIEPHTIFHLAPNVRPSLEVEQLAPAHYQMAEIVRSVKLRQVRGVQELIDWAGMDLLPTSTAFGKIISFLSKVYDPSKGVLGVEASPSATTIAAAFAGELTLGVYPQMRAGHGITDLVLGDSLKEVTRWLPIDLSDDDVRDYAYNKSLHPGTIPTELEELAVDHALTTELIRKAMIETLKGISTGQHSRRSGLLPWFEPVIASGSDLVSAPTFAQMMLILINALQPTGVTTLVLDQNRLAPSLGAAARVNPILVVQVIESGAFLNLGTVISPVANVKPGIPIMRLHVEFDSGDETILDVKQGSFEVVPLPTGRSAKLRLQPFHRADVGMGGAGRAGSVRVTGGALGIVVDARGRPIRIPEDRGRNRELIRKWLWTFGSS